MPLLFAVSVCATRTITVQSFDTCTKEDKTDIPISKKWVSADHVFGHRMPDASMGEMATGIAHALSPPWQPLHKLDADSDFARLSEEVSILIQRIKKAA